MNKKSSKKEVGLLLLLVILLAFYFIDKGPFARIIEDLQAQRDTAQSEVNTLQPFADQMDTWEAAIEEVNKKYNGKPKSIPDYNNINSVIAEMSIIFDGDSSYTINFSDPSLEDHIVSRYVKITFSCYTYDEMINKLYQINNSENRYRISNLSVVEGSNDLYSVSLDFVAYEYSADNEI